MKRRDFAGRAAEQGVDGQIPLQVNARRRPAESHQTDVRSESPALRGYADWAENPRDGGGKRCKLGLGRRARPQHSRVAASGKATEAVKLQTDRVGLDFGQSIFDPLNGRTLDLADEGQREMQTGIVEPAGVAKAELEASDSRLQLRRQVEGNEQARQRVWRRYGASRLVSRSARR